jgi:hypothetical protein
MGLSLGAGFGETGPDWCDMVRDGPDIGIFFERLLRLVVDIDSETEDEVCCDFFLRDDFSFRL